MTNVLREKPVAAIRDRAEAFVNKARGILESKDSVDVYVLLHCYALDCVTHFMFSPGGLRSLNTAEDFALMEELTYHHSLQSKDVERVISI